MNKGVSTMFFDNSEFPNVPKDNCSSGILAIIDANSCFNHVLVISIDVVLLFVFFCTFVYRVASNKTPTSVPSQKLSSISVFSAVCNGLLALAYLTYGIWKFAEELSPEGNISLLYKWLVPLIHGLTWLLLSLSISLRKLQVSHIATAKTFSIFSFLLGAFLCMSSIFEAMANRKLSFGMVLNVLCVVGGILLIFSSFKVSKYAKPEQEIDNGAFYTPLQRDNITPFSSSGLLSTMSFWWLNPLMKKGKQKILEDEDIPHLREEDRAETLYSIFIEQFNKRKLRGSFDPPSILSTIFFSQKKPILISGIFALIKVLTLSSNPLFLAAL